MVLCLLIEEEFDQIDKKHSTSTKIKSFTVDLCLFTIYSLKPLIFINIAKSIIKIYRHRKK